MVTAAKSQGDDTVRMENLQQVLENIGAENKISTQELQTIFHEVGGGSGISAERMVKLL